MEDKVKRFLDALTPKKRSLAMRITAIVLKSHPSIKEDIKWGNLTFVSNGNIAFVYTYDRGDYINLGFFKATQLSDPKRLFEGTGKGMRHININDEKEINHKQVKAWVREAVKLNELGMKSISK